MRAIRSAQIGLGLIAISILATGSPSHAENPSTPTLDSVMEALASSGGVEARFRETRHLSILSTPIVSLGQLYFSPPDTLARHVTEPGPARVIVLEDHVSFQDDTGIQTLDLSSSEVAQAMVGNVIVLLRGDLIALRRNYEVKFHVEDDVWTLDLEPRNPVVRQLIQRLRVDGRGNRLVRLESTETSGDVTVTEFLSVKVGVEYSPEAHAGIFSLVDSRSTPDRSP